MKLTLVNFAKILPTNTRRWPKSSFRRPMQGRYGHRKKEKRAWDITMGEQIEEEVNELGIKVPVREMVPMIMVPDLTDCKLKPYVTYSVEKHHEPPVTSKDLFDMLYAPAIEAEYADVALEDVPDPGASPSIYGRVKNMFKTGEKKDSCGRVVTSDGVHMSNAYVTILQQSVKDLEFILSPGCWVGLVPLHLVAALGW